MAEAEQSQSQTIEEMKAFVAKVEVAHASTLREQADAEIAEGNTNAVDELQIAYGAYRQMGDKAKGHLLIFDN